MTLSNTVNEEFRSHLQNLKNLNGVDLSVRVLTTGFWPGQNAPPPINLPRIPSQVLHLHSSMVGNDGLYYFRLLMCSRISILPSILAGF